MSSHPQASAPSWSRQEFAGLDLGVKLWQPKFAMKTGRYH